MDSYGFIHEKTDIKLLILFLIKDLPAPIEAAKLYDLCAECDGGIGYFVYSEAVEELILAGQMNQVDGEYVITENGKNNIVVVESALPYSVRNRAEMLLEPVMEQLLRQSMIHTGSKKTESGVITELSMNDGAGEIISLRLLCGSEEQAAKIRKNFRHHAEDYYQKIIELLAEG
ncbi:MAG: DUF4364 family protein [Oscillospiraceae bacterium]|nr:DUF4364 family protein [Oscillospiraceae bacterium]